MAKLQAIDGKTPVNSKDKKKFSDKAREYKASLQSAYNAGYTSGWNDYENVSKRFGTKTAAVRGYSNGMRNRKRATKYQNKVGK